MRKAPVGRVEILPTAKNKRTSQSLLMGVNPVEPLFSVQFDVFIGRGSIDVQPGLLHCNCPSHTEDGTANELSNQQKTPSFQAFSFFLLPFCQITHKSTPYCASKPDLGNDLVRSRDFDNCTGCPIVGIFLNTIVEMGDTARSSPPATSPSPVKSPTKSLTPPASSPAHHTIPLVADEVTARESPLLS